MSTASHTGATWRTGLPPGVYERVAPPTRRLDVRMDVAAFVGLTERGSVATATAVQSWSEFQAQFGGCGGGRQLPDAVWLFFANGGRRAVVSRAVRYADAPTARYAFPTVRDGADPLRIYAHDPGAWGNGLRLEWGWRRSPLRTAPTPIAPDADGRSTTLELPASAAPAVGAVLRSLVVYRDGAPDGAEGFVEAVVTVETVAPAGAGRVRLTLSDRVPALAPPGAVAAATPLEELRGRLVARLGELVEDHDDLGLDPRHPEAIGTRLGEGASRLVRLGSAGGSLRPDGAFSAPGVWTAAAVGVLEAVGGDGAATTDRSVFFEALGAGPAGSEAAAWAQRPSPLDALDAYDAVNEPEPVSLVCLPDLYHPVASLEPLAIEPVPGGLRFGPCEPPAADVSVPAELDWPRLSIPGGDDEQAALVAWCEARGGVVAILDLPPGRTAGEILAWREAHASARAAAYGPYLRLAPPEDPLAPLREAPPCGSVCGIIARQERRAGVHVAPANLALAGIPALSPDPLLPDPGFLHEARVNLIRATEEGLRVMGSRTTSLDEAWTHLSVRRLVDWLARQVRLDCRWAPFEPNHPQLWRRLVLTVERRLRQAGAAGAWAGATPADSWFVRCDASTHTPADLDAGRAVVLVGVAPAVPAEFLVFQVVLLRDGEVVTEVGGG